LGRTGTPGSKAADTTAALGFGVRVKSYVAPKGRNKTGETRPVGAKGSMQYQTEHGTKKSRPDRICGVYLTSDKKTDVFLQHERKCYVKMVQRIMFDFGSSRVADRTTVYGH